MKSRKGRVRRAYAVSRASFAAQGLRLASASKSKPRSFRLFVLQDARPSARLPLDLVEDALPHQRGSLGSGQRRVRHAYAVSRVSCRLSSLPGICNLLLRPGEKLTLQEELVLQDAGSISPDLPRPCASCAPPSLDPLKSKRGQMRHAYALLRGGLLAIVFVAQHLQLASQSQGRPRSCKQ